MLQMVRQESGKVTARHHFINEARLINGVLSGQFSALDRERLSESDLSLLANLEVRNSVLIGRGLPYAERKTLLRHHAIELRPSVPQWRPHEHRLLHPFPAGVFSAVAPEKRQQRGYALRQRTLFTPEIRLIPVAVASQSPAMGLAGCATCKGARRSLLRFLRPRQFPAPRRFILESIRRPAMASNSFTPKSPYSSVRGRHHIRPNNVCDTLDNCVFDVASGVGTVYRRKSDPSIPFTFGAECSCNCKPSPVRSKPLRSVSAENPGRPWRIGKPSDRRIEKPAARSMSASRQTRQLLKRA